MPQKAKNSQEKQTPRLLDPKMWTPFIREYLKERPKAAHSFAVNLAFTREAIERGPEGVAQAVEAMSQGIRRVFRETALHRPCLRLFELSLLGYVNPPDEPEALLESAIERSEAQIRQVEDVLKTAGKPRTGSRRAKKGAKRR